MDRYGYWCISTVGGFTSVLLSGNSAVLKEDSPLSRNERTLLYEGKDYCDECQSLYSARQFSGNHEEK